MLKISSSYIKKITAASNVLTHYRKFNYQKEIYTNKFELNSDRNLQKELVNSNLLRAQEPNLHRFVDAYRKSGHKQAKLDPLNQEENIKLDELDPNTYGRDSQGIKLYNTSGILFNNLSESSMTIEQIETYLKDIYSNNISFEFDFIQNEEEKLWLTKEFEKLRFVDLEAKIKTEILVLLAKSEVFYLQ